MICPKFTYRVGFLAAAASLLSGCVAALLPIVAGGALGKSVLDKEAVRPVTSFESDIANERSFATGETAAVGKEGNEGHINTGFRQDKAKIIALETDAEIRELIAGYDGRSPKNTYHGIVRYSSDIVAKYRKEQRAESALLKPGYIGGRGERRSCFGLPPAIMIDIDNAVGQPGARAALSPLLPANSDDLSSALTSLRSEKITIIWISDLPESNARKLISRLRSAGILESSDFLSLNRGKEDRKQLRRAAAAESHCIIAIAGDQRSDFDELFGYLRDPANFADLDPMLGNGWFLHEIPDVQGPAGDFRQEAD